MPLFGLDGSRKVHKGGVGLFSQTIGPILAVLPPINRRHDSEWVSHPASPNFHSIRLQWKQQVTTSSPPLHPSLLALFPFSPRKKDSHHAFGFETYENKPTGHGNIYSPTYHLLPSVHRRSPPSFSASSQTNTLPDFSCSRSLAFKRRLIRGSMLSLTASNTICASLASRTSESTLKIVS